MSNPPAEAAEEDILKKISDLKQELSRLREKRYTAVEEVRKLRQKRVERVERLRAVRAQLETLFQEYTSRLNELKELKQKKDALFEVIKEMRREFEELKNLMKKTQGLNPDVLEKRIKSLEWRIQTSSLTLDEEKRLIQKIAELEKKFTEAKKILKIKEKGNEEKAEFLAKRIELATIRQRISSIVTEISEKRKLIASLKEERERLKKELDELKNKIEEKSKEIRELDSQIEQKNKELDKQVEVQKRMEKGVYGGNNDAEVLERKRKIAEEKLKKGERLSFEDFYALYGTSRGKDEDRGNLH